MHKTYTEEKSIAGERADAWLSLDAADGIERLLCEAQLLNADEKIVSVEPAGRGNMNFTARVVTDQRRLVVKQARPWVERFPSIPAPVERAAFEIAFYQSVTKVPALAKRMPRLLATVPDQHLLVLEDLGAVADASHLYGHEDIDQLLPPMLKELVAWLVELHTSLARQPNDPPLQNLALRQLNAEHLFVVPFQNPPAVDLDAITPGLAAIAAGLADNETLLERLDALKKLYLSDGPHLIHGDFFPGSWLCTSDGASVIDPEFCFHGRAEFDVAVLTAHVQMLRGRADGALAIVQQWYQPSTEDFDWQLVNDWAAVEVLRRIFGVAQLPLPWEIEVKSQLIDAAVHQLVENR